MNNWNYNIDEAPKAQVLWLTVKYGDEQLEVLRCTMKQALGLKIRAWKPIESWPSPAGPPPKPEQIKGLDFGSTATLIKAVEKRTREIVAWEQKYEVKK